MSSLSISSTGQGLYQFLKTLSTQSPSTPTSTSSADSASSAGAASSTDSTDQSSSGSPVAGAPHHHRHGGGFAKLQSAVTDALQNAQADGSADPNKVVSDTIANFLKGDSGSTSSTDTTTSTDAAASTTNDPATTPSAFFQTLQQYGIDPKQFHADFLAAVKDAQGGTVDPSTAFQSLPVGSAVDEVA